MHREFDSGLTIIHRHKSIHVHGSPTIRGPKFSFQASLCHEPQHSIHRDAFCISDNCFSWSGLISDCHSFLQMQMAFVFDIYRCHSFDIHSWKQFGSISRGHSSTCRFQGPFISCSFCRATAPCCDTSQIIQSCGVSGCIHPLQKGQVHPPHHE